MSIKITHEFDGIETAMAHLARMHSTSQSQIVAEASKSSQQQLAQAVVDAKPQAQPPGAVSLDDVQNAFRTYLAKGQGRTAATGMAILKDHGVASIKTAAPEQYGALRAAFDAAGPENPLGKAA